MRPALFLSVAACAALALTACSKASDSAQTTPAEAAPPPGAAPATDAQRKAILASLPATYQGADLDNGQSKFALCKSCHTFAEGGDSGVGPNLWGVFGRKAGSLAGFSYSDGVKALAIPWDADRINTWISNPRAMVPGTKMTYAGMESPKDRIDVVAYLKVVTTAPPK